MMSMLYVTAGLTIAAGVGGAWAGHKVTSNAWKADMLSVQQEHTKSILRQAERSNDAAAELEKARATRKVVYRTVTKEVERIVAQPAYAQQCFTDDGVRLANSAIVGEAPAAGGPGPALSKPAPLGRRASVNGS